MIALVRNGRPVTIGNFPKRPPSKELAPSLPHDPLPSFYLPDVLREMARLCFPSCERAYERAAEFCCRNAGYGTQGCSERDQIFIRAPRIRYKRAFGMACVLTWLYDGQELTLAFNVECKTGAILDGRRVSEEEAVEAVCEWNKHVILGEARRIREAREGELECIASTDEPDDEEDATP